MKASSRSRAARAALSCLAGLLAGALSLAVHAVTPIPEIEPNNTAATATVLTLSSGRAIGTASISRGDLDFFRIDGVPAGARIWVSTDTGGPQNAGANSTDTVMDLLAANGTTIIETDDNDGTGNGADGGIESEFASAIAGRTLTTGGTYFLRVRAFSANDIIDPYVLYVVVTTVAATPETEPNGALSSANVILAGGLAANVFSASIGAAGDDDYYAMTVRAGDVLFVAVDADPERDGTSPIVAVEIRDSVDFRVLSIANLALGSVANPLAKAAPYTAPVSGTYYVKVRQFSTGTGTYHLMVANMTASTLAATPEFEPNDTTRMAKVLTFNAARAIGTGSIRAVGDLDYWRIDSVPAGARLWVSTDTGGPQNAGATSRDTVIDLLAADGTTIIETDNDDGTGNGADGTIETGLASAIAGRTLATGGTYYLRVRALSPTDIIDPYTLYVVVTTASNPETEANNTAATANVIPGTKLINVYNGSIGAAGDVDYYAMTLGTGDVVFVSADADPGRVGTGTDLVVEVRDPADALVLSINSSLSGSVANPAAEAAPYTAPVSGTYYVKVRHSSPAGTGTYDLMVANMTRGVAPITLLGAKSRHVHGTAGAFDLPLSLTPTAPTTEPRQGPAAAIVFTFNKADTGTGVSGITISEGTAGLSAVGSVGNDFIVFLTGVADQQYVTVRLDSLRDADGSFGESTSVRIGFLRGDVNQNRAVTVGDLVLINAQLGLAVNATNFLKDVNANGLLAVSDLVITNSALGRSLAAP